MLLPSKPSQKLRVRQDPPAQQVIGRANNPIHYLGYLREYWQSGARVRYRKVRPQTFGQEQEVVIHLNEPYITIAGKLKEGAKVECWVWEDETGERIRCWLEMC
jgi:hypothetical protein